MAGEVVDIRRSDLRSNVLENPYWITSGKLDHATADDKFVIFFSFPIGASAVINPSAIYGNRLILLHQFVVEVTEFFAGGTIAFDIGQYSLATDDVTTAGDAALVDVDMYYDTVDGAADIITNVGNYVPDSACAWLTAKAAATWGTNASIVPADTTVLCIAGTLTSDAPITQGELYLHALISEVPLVNG